MPGKTERMEAADASVTATEQDKVHGMRTPIL